MNTLDAVAAIFASLCIGKEMLNYHKLLRDEADRFTIRQDVLSKFLDFAWPFLIAVVALLWIWVG